MNILTSPLILEKRLLTKTIELSSCEGLYIRAEYANVNLRGEFENWTFHHYPEMEIIKIEGRVSVASQLCPRGDC